MLLHVYRKVNIKKIVKINKCKKMVHYYHIEIRLRRIKIYLCFVSDVFDGYGHVQFARSLNPSYN